MSRRSKSKPRPATPIIGFPSLTLFNRRYVREVYSAYLHGKSVDEIVDMMFMQKGAKYHPAEVNEILDMMNAALL